METQSTDTTQNRDIDALVEDFEFLDDWEERYRYVIELGKDLPEFPASQKDGDHKVEGCVSQVWLRADEERGNGETVLRFAGDSDAHIVRGLIAILFRLYSGHTPQEIMATDADAVFKRIGLDTHLTPQRSNGLQAMVQRIRKHAASAESAG